MRFVTLTRVHDSFWILTKKLRPTPFEEFALTATLDITL